MHVLAGDGYGAYPYKAVSVPTDTTRIMFEGRVIDESANSVEGAAVTVNGVEGISAANGQFSIVVPKETPQYILNIDKIEFEFFSRTLNAPATGVSYQLFPAFEVPETQIPSFDAAKPFTVSETRDPKCARLANVKSEALGGAEIEFESAAIAAKDGESEKIVTGPIKIFVGTYDCNDQLPGNFTGINKNGQPVRLSSYGAVSVSLRGMGGKPLNIAKGKSALVRLPIDGNLIGGSPPTIKLWSFDESRGVWIEEGVATKNGNAYEGKVTHFSAVNMDLNSTTGACTRIRVDKTVFPFDFRLHITSSVVSLPNGHQDQLVSDQSGLSVVGEEPQNTQFVFEMYNADGSGPLFSGQTKRTIMTGPTTNLGNKYPIQQSDYPYLDCSSEVDYDQGFPVPNYEYAKRLFTKNQPGHRSREYSYGGLLRKTWLRSQ